MMFHPGQLFEEHFVVSSETYAGFIQIFKDKNPLHTDEVFAKDKGFQGKVMHGNILNGFVSYFIGECLPTKNVIIFSQTIQFNNPVYLADELQFNAEITGVHDSVNAVDFKYVFKNKEGKTVAKGKFQIGLLG